MSRVSMQGHRDRELVQNLQSERAVHPCETRSVTEYSLHRAVGRDGAWDLQSIP